MVKLREEGKVRAVGVSSHGLSVLEFVLEIPEMDLVWARRNYAGLNMDTGCLGMYDQMALIYWLKKCVKFSLQGQNLLFAPKPILSLYRRMCIKRLRTHFKAYTLSPRGL